MWTKILTMDAILWKIMHYCILCFLINMICFFLNIRLFFIGKSTLVAHYFPIISTFVLDVSVQTEAASVDLQVAAASWWTSADTEVKKPEAALLFSLLSLWFLQCLINYINGDSLVLFCEVMLLHKFGIWCFVLVRIKKKVIFECVVLLSSVSWKAP